MHNYAVSLHIYIRYIYIYRLMHVCLYKYKHMDSYLHTQTHTHTHTYIYIYIYDACIHLHVEIYACLLTYIHMYIPTYSWTSACRKMDVNIYIYTLEAMDYNSWDYNLLAITAWNLHGKYSPFTAMLIWPLITIFGIDFFQQLQLEKEQNW